MGGGYCLFNNVAIAALHALEQHQLERVAIVDFDVHHGNGTQAIFAEDPRVLFISVHQAGNYPLFSGEEHTVHPACRCLLLCHMIHVHIYDSQAGAGLFLYVWRHQHCTECSAAHFICHSA